MNNSKTDDINVKYRSALMKQNFPVTELCFNYSWWWHKGCRWQVVSLVKMYSVGVPLKTCQDSVMTWFFFSTYPRAPIKMSNIPRDYPQWQEAWWEPVTSQIYIYLRGRIQAMRCARSLTYFDLSLRDSGIAAVTCCSACRFALSRFMLALDPRPGSSGLAALLQFAM